VEITENRHI